MSNSKGNTYPILILTDGYQVFGVDAQQKTHQLSDADQVRSIAISEDGTIWGISPDAIQGNIIVTEGYSYDFKLGYGLLWSSGDGIWHEVKTDIPGGLSITGGPGSSCYYITKDKKVWKLDTDGNATAYDETNDYEEFAYGGGYVWSVFTNDEYNPRLHYSKADRLDWKAFPNYLQATSISVNNEGDCVGILQASPTTFSKDGSSSFSTGSGVDGKTGFIDAKNRIYLLSYDSGANGRVVYSCEKAQGGTFVETPLSGMQVIATYHQES